MIPRTRCSTFPIIASSVRLAFVLLVYFIFLIYVNIYEPFDPNVSMLSGLPPQSLASQGFGSGAGLVPLDLPSPRSLTTSSPGSGAEPFPPESPLGFLPLERAPEVMKFFIMVQSLSLCLMGYE
jgi:hypothetical protein